MNNEEIEKELKEIRILIEAVAKQSGCYNPLWKATKGDKRFLCSQTIPPLATWTN